MLSDENARFLKEPAGKSIEASYAQLTKDPTVKTNLIIFICAWTVTTFNNFLLQFLVNTYELVYPSALGLSVAELIGFLFAKHGVSAEIIWALRRSRIIVRYRVMERAIDGAKSSSSSQISL